MKINVIVKANSKKGPLVELKPDNSLLIYVREIAADNKANQAIIKLLSSYYKIPKTKINIIAGHSSRHKIIEIQGI